MAEGLASISSHERSEDMADGFADMSSEEALLTIDNQTQLRATCINVPETTGASKNLLSSSK